ncbi:MFS transporter [Candidatus Woesearchaeota archaeon]|nr:MFS transporter [Candidatus Woesearchaeota archaeon]
MAKKDFERNIWKYYIFVFLKNMNLIVPIFMLFFLENGLSLTQAMFLITIACVMGLVLEIPSGVFADLWGRKGSMILGALCLIGGYFIRAASTSFIEFAGSMVILATGAAFISGADKAMIYDSLKEIKKEHLYKKIAGTENFFASGGMAIGSLIGGSIAIFGLRKAHYAMLIPMGLLLLISFTFKEPEMYKKVIKRNYLGHLKEGVIFSFTHKRVRNLILFSGLMIGLMMTSHMFYQPYMKQIGVPLEAFGVLYLLFLGVAAVSAKGAYKIEKKLGEKKSIIMIPLLLALQLFLIGKFSFYNAFLFLFIGEFIWGFNRPILANYINEHVESYHRATVLSVNAMGHKIVWAIAAPLIGLFADLWSVQTAFLIMAVIVAVISIVILSGWKLRKR